MKSRIFVLFVAFGLLLVSAFAQNAGDLRRRMSERLPEIDSLKSQELVGENNRGFLEVRGAGGEAASRVVTEENRDRQAVYAFIAKETGSSADAVGQARAKQIATSSRPGVWIQSTSGEWKKK